jgi:hypothetical protein
VTFHLDGNRRNQHAGQSKVWSRSNFVSDSVNFRAYVDDVVIRKCVGGICPTAPTGAEPSTVQVRRAQRVVTRQDHRLPAGEQLPK